MAKLERNGNKHYNAYLLPVKQKGTWKDNCVTKRIHVGANLASLGGVVNDEAMKLACGVCPGDIAYATVKPKVR